MLLNLNLPGSPFRIMLVYLLCAVLFQIFCEDKCANSNSEEHHLHVIFFSICVLKAFRCLDNHCKSGLELEQEACYPMRVRVLDRQHCKHLYTGS